MELVDAQLLDKDGNEQGGQEVRACEKRSNDPRRHVYVILMCLANTSVSNDTFTDSPAGSNADNTSSRTTRYARRSVDTSLAVARLWKRAGGRTVPSAHARKNLP